MEEVDEQEVLGEREEVLRHLGARGDWAGLGLDRGGGGGVMGTHGTLLAGQRGLQAVKKVGTASCLLDILIPGLIFPAIPLLPSFASPLLLQ